MIYTSYFANWRNWPSGMIPISISAYPPKNSKIKTEMRLAPPTSLLKSFKSEGMSKEEYTKEYLLVLARYSPKLVGEYLTDHVVLCYEKSGDFCHRNILAEWLKDAGFDVAEVSRSE